MDEHSDDDGAFLLSCPSLEYSQSRSECPVTSNIRRENPDSDGGTIDSATYLSFSPLPRTTCVPDLAQGSATVAACSTGLTARGASGTPGFNPAAVVAPSSVDPEADVSSSTPSPRSARMPGEGDVAMADTPVVDMPPSCPPTQEDGSVDQAETQVDPSLQPPTAAKHVPPPPLAGMKSTHGTGVAITASVVPRTHGADPAALLSSAVCLLRDGTPSVKDKPKSIVTPRSIAEAKQDAAAIGQADTGDAEAGEEEDEEELPDAFAFASNTQSDADVRSDAAATTTGLPKKAKPQERNFCAFARTRKQGTSTTEEATSSKRAAAINKQTRTYADRLMQQRCRAPQASPVRLPSSVMGSVSRSSSGSARQDQDLDAIMCGDATKGRRRKKKAKKKDKKKRKKKRKKATSSKEPPSTGKVGTKRSRPVPSHLPQTSSSPRSSPQRDSRSPRRKQDPLSSPLSAYSIFFGQWQRILRHHFPDLDTKAIGSRIGQAWRDRTPQQALVYEHLAAVHRVRMTVDHAALAGDTQARKPAMALVHLLVADLVPPSEQSVGEQGSTATVLGGFGAIKSAKQRKVRKAPKKRQKGTKGAPTQASTSHDEPWSPSQSSSSGDDTRWSPASHRARLTLGVLDVDDMEGDNGEAREEEEEQRRPRSESHRLRQLERAVRRRVRREAACVNEADNLGRRRSPRRHKQRSARKRVRSSAFGDTAATAVDPESSSAAQPKRHSGVLRPGDGHALQGTLASYLNVSLSPSAAIDAPRDSLQALLRDEEEEQEEAEEVEEDEEQAALVAVAQEASTNPNERTPAAPAPQALPAATIIVDDVEECGESSGSFGPTEREEPHDGDGDDDDVDDVSQWPTQHSSTAHSDRPPSLASEGTEVPRSTRRTLSTLAAAGAARVAVEEDPVEDVWNTLGSATAGNDEAKQGREDSIDDVSSNEGAAGNTHDSSDDDVDSHSHDTPTGGQGKKASSAAVSAHASTLPGPDEIMELPHEVPKQGRPLFSGFTFLLTGMRGRSKTVAVPSSASQPQQGGSQTNNSQSPSKGSKAKEQGTDHGSAMQSPPAGYEQVDLVDYLQQLINQEQGKLFTNADWQRLSTSLHWRATELRRKCHYKDWPGLILLADRYYPTPKYLCAVAAGVPCLDFQWALDCYSTGRILSWQRYVLPMGVDIFTQESLYSTNMDPITALQGMRFELHGSSTFVEDWKRILKECGAVIRDSIPDCTRSTPSSSPRHSRSRRRTSDVSSSPSSKAASPNYHFVSQESEALPNQVFLAQARKVDKPVVNVAWIKQWMLSGEQPDWQRHEDLFIARRTAS